MRVNFRVKAEGMDYLRRASGTRRIYRVENEWAGVSERLDECVRACVRAWALWS